LTAAASQHPDKLAARHALLDRARRAVQYWARRATTPEAKAMLREAQALLALRKQQVAAADRVSKPHAGVSTVGQAGIALIVRSEGFSAKPYWDSLGQRWTIGYGETQGVTQHTPPVTRGQALVQLRRRVNRDYLAHVLTVAKAHNVTLTQNEADALASITYNNGPGIADAGHTLGDALRSGNRRRIADAFLVYNKAGNPLRFSQGLMNRRKAERALFLR
jgi:GH24 family phage-related lysozyme (muramidase)